MNYFVGTYLSLNPYDLPWKPCIFRYLKQVMFSDGLVLHLGGPNKQFGTHKIVLWGGGGGHGSLN